jgi:hypothetical protein
MTSCEVRGAACASMHWESSFGLFSLYVANPVLNIGENFFPYLLVPLEFGDALIPQIRNSKSNS